MIDNTVELIQHIKKLETAQETTNSLLRQMLDYWKSLDVSPDNSFHEEIVKEGIKLPESRN